MAKRQRQEMNHANASNVPLTLDVNTQIRRLAQVTV